MRLIHALALCAMTLMMPMVATASPLGVGDPTPLSVASRVSNDTVIQKLDRHLIVLGLIVPSSADRTTSRQTPRAGSPHTSALTGRNVDMQTRTAFFAARAPSEVGALGKLSVA